MCHVEKPEKNYIIIESLSSQQDGDNDFWKCVHVIDFNNTDKIKLGRGHDTDVRIHDISVSRLHAYIKRDPDSGFVFIEDNGSKFGTLVQI